MTVEERARGLFFSMDKVLDVKYRKTIIAAFEQALRDQIEDGAKEADTVAAFLRDNKLSGVGDVEYVALRIRALAAPKEEDQIRARSEGNQS